MSPHPSGNDGVLGGQVDRQKLMRVYGALMWSMGKVSYSHFDIHLMEGELVQDMTMGSS